MTLGHAAIELHGLSRRYGLQYVLKDVNLVVTAGKVVVLRGSNGAGKTTLLRVLSTRLRPSKGRGSVFGFDLVRHGNEVRKHAAYLSVLGGSYPSLTALENLQLASTFYGKRLSPVLLQEHRDEVGLLGVQRKLVRTFSSGMKKRLGLARLLVSGAQLWLLDEPYAALDEDGKILIDQLLLTAKAEGKTVLMASHELERSAAFADSVLALEGGHLGVHTPRQREAEVSRV
jgi:heme exporter protein A